MATIRDPWGKLKSVLDPGGFIEDVPNKLGITSDDDEPGSGFGDIVGGLSEGPTWTPDPESFEIDPTGTLASTYQGGREAYGSRIPRLIKAAQIEREKQEEGRRAQMGLLSQLEGQAGGRLAGPSRAAQLGKMALESGMRGAAAKGAAGAGIGTVMGTQGAAGEAAIRKATGMRAAETAATQKQAMGLMGKGRVQDIELATSQAKLEQQASLANQQAAMEQTRMNDAMVTKFTQLGFSLEEAQTMAAIEMERILADMVITEMGGRTKIYGALEDKITTEKTGRKSNVASFFGALFGKSDENLKKNIKSEDKEIDSFMNHLNSYSYDYKDEKHGKGRRHGVMAQDVEKSTLGSEMVVDMADGKAVNLNKGVSAALSGLARLNKRLNKLEDK